MQSAADDDRRRRLGAFYTPVEVADRVVAMAAQGWAVPAAPVVVDPACGDGALLLAAARWLESLGHPRSTVVEDLVWGFDLDPVAVEACRGALHAWASAVGPPPQRTHVVVADTLDHIGDALPGPTRVDLVVGNPPFLNQLESGTARTRARAAALRSVLGEVSASYTDTAGLFLAGSLAWVRDGGRVALILPESVLAARDAAGVRDHCLTNGAVQAVWLAGEPVFDAHVDVCALVVERGAPAGPVQRRHRLPFVDAGVVGAPELGQPWAALVADLRGVPAVSLPEGGVLGDLATATAGFRDQYYGIVAHVREADRNEAADAEVPLVTSGLVDPMHLRWGESPARFAGHRWWQPVVDVAEIRALADAGANDALARWSERVLVPKVVVATQTKVIEAVVDVEGSWWPSVPSVAVIAAPGDLWRVAAVLMAPSVSAWALANYGGTALSADAVKLSASQIESIPLPVHPQHWDDAALALERASTAAGRGDSKVWREALVEAGLAMERAYGSSGSSDVIGWWEARLPPWRGPHADRPA